MFVKTLKPFVFLVVVIAVVSLACMGGGDEPTPEPPPPPVEEPQQPEPEQPAEPAAPEPPTETPAPVAEEFFTEEFEADLNNWSQEVVLNSDEGDTSQANVYLDDGRLVFDLGKFLITYMFYDPYEYTDVRIDVRVENRGTNVNNVLLVCRESDEGLYLVNIANSGLYAMYVYDVENKNYFRMADGGSTKIKSGKEVNDYTLICRERTLTLYINDVETRQYTDNKYVVRKGRVGVGVASENQVPVKLEFENVTISEP